MNPAEDLPDVVDMSSEAYEAYFDLWLLYVATGRKHLPETGGLGDQSTIAMQTIMELDSYYSKILTQSKEDTDASEI